MKELSSTIVPSRNPMMGFVAILICVLAILPLTPLLKAQSFYGTLVGTVTDPSGAVVPGASVTVTNMGTGVAAKARTDAGGKYSVQDLLPANYKVEVEKSNFKKIERTSVTVEVGAVVRIDITLAVGNVSEIVEVTTATPLLQTDTSSLNQEVEGDVVQQMPLNGRNVMNLVELSPGVIPTGAASGSTGLNQSAGRTAGGIGWNNYEIGGGIQGWSADYIDGVPNQLLGANPEALVPTQDAVQELTVVSSDATADYGRFAGGVVVMTTKSGSNAFHASAWEYLRNRDFNANTWFNNHNGVARARWNQNQYGAMGSGPIKKDKAFFMFTWENFKILSNVLDSGTVPTQAMQNGTLNHNFADPRGDCSIVNNGNGTYSITNLYGPAAAGGLDSTCGDPLGRVMKEYFPLPNVTATGYNYFTSAPLTNNQTQYNARVDYQVTSKDRFFARYSKWTSADGHNSIFANGGSPAFGSTTPTSWPTASAAPTYNTQQAVVGDTYTLNSTTVLDVRASFSRQTYAAALTDSSVNETLFDQYQTGSFKPYTTLAPQMDLKSLAVYKASGNDGLEPLNSIANFNANFYNSYSLDASLVKILGPHSFKVGAEVRLMDNSGSPYVAGASGSYTYNNTTTNSGLLGSSCGTSCSGDEFAALLMGLPQGGSAVQFQAYSNTANYAYYQGYYLMDDWQVSRKLTLNLGLRYELPGAIAERNNKLDVLLPNALDPYTGITGTEALVASSLYSPRTGVVEKYDLFAPRVGFAYRATNNTVLHVGYGLSYIPNDLPGTNGFGVLSFSSPFNSTLTQVNISSYSPTQTQPQPNIQTALGCVVNGPTTPGCGSLVTLAGIRQAKVTPNFMTAYGNLNTYLGQTLAAPYPYESYPYVQQWNAALSHQFKGDWMTQVIYSGLKGTNLPQIGDQYVSLDELQSKYYSMGGAALTATAATCANAPGLAGKIQVGQCLRKNPYYHDMQNSAPYTAVQSYKSLLVTAQKRFGSNGVLNANYGWSKNMSDTDTENLQLETTAAPHVDQGEAQLQDFNNIKGTEYSLISYDVTNRFVLDYELALPFGKGQKYANSLGGPLNAIASGWAINGITIFQSGFPTFITSANANLLTANWGAGSLRPNVVPGCNKKVEGGSQTRVLAGAWFNTSCFVYPFSAGDPNGQVTFGNEPRVDPQLRSDGVKNFDFAFQKSTPLGFESTNFVFRAEFFNILNRVQFAPAVTQQGASNFGAIVNQANNPRQIQLSGRINF